MANECNTSDSPEAQARHAKAQAEEAKIEKRLLEKFDELKAVSQAHAVISDNYFNAMLDNIKNSEKENRVQNEEDDKYQIKTLMGIDRIGEVASSHYHSLLSIDNNLNIISSSLKTFLSNTSKTNSEVQLSNREISENRDNLNKNLHKNRNDLMVDLWSSQTSQLTSIHSVLSNHAETNEKLLKGFVSNISKTIPEKSTITQNRREQQKRDLILQSEREKDRSILLGIHRLLEKMKFGGATRGGGGGGGGGLGILGLGALLIGGAGKFFWKWIKAGFGKVIKMLIGGATFVKNSFINVFRGIGGFLSKIGSKLKIIFGRLGTFLKGIFVGLRNFLGKTFKFLKEGFVKFFKGIGGFLSKIGSKLKIVFGRLGTFFKGIFSSIRGFLGQTVKFVSEGFGKFFKGIGGFLGNIGSKLKNVFGKVGGFLKGAFAGLRGFLLKFAPMLARVGSAAMASLGVIGSKAVAMMGPAAAVAAAAAGGWAIGAWLDKKFGISDKIAEWLSGPNASEIAAQQLEEKSFKKQNKANISKQSLIKQAVVSTGLDENVIKSMMSGMNNEQFDKLSKEQQDLIIKAQQESAKMTAQLMIRTAKLSVQALKDAGRFISKSDRLEIEKRDKVTTKVTQAVVKQSKTVRMLRTRQLQQIKAKKQRREKESIQINVQIRDKQKIMNSKKQSIEKVHTELQENIFKDTKINEKVISLEDKRIQDKVDVRNNNMSDNLARIAKHTEEALKKKNTYIVNPANQPGVMTSVGNMVKAGGR